MLLDSWQEHDLLECVAKAAPGNAEEDPRQQRSLMPSGLEDYYGKKN